MIRGLFETGKGKRIIFVFLSFHLSMYGHLKSKRIDKSSFRKYFNNGSYKVINKWNFAYTW